MFHFFSSPSSPPTHLPNGRRQSLVSVFRAAIGRSITRSRVAAQGLVEYSLVLVLIAIVVIGSIAMVGEQTSTVFTQISCSIRGGTMHVDHGNGNSNRCT